MARFKDVPENSKILKILDENDVKEIDAIENIAVALEQTLNIALTNYTNQTILLNARKQEFFESVSEGLDQPTHGYKVGTDKEGNTVLFEY